ncbi:MAG: hypothetical protein ACREMY_29890 [bacterium]
MGGSTTTTSTMALTWTATGDDGTSGTANMNEVRYTTGTLNTGNFFTAKRAGSEPTPASSGTGQSMTVTGLSAGTCYHFGLKSFDEWGNGPLSNVVTCGTRPPAYVTSYCSSDEIRCTFQGTYGSCGCGNYSCAGDESCAEAEITPTYAYKCGTYCQ